MRKNFKYFICIMLVFMALCTNIEKVDLLANQLESDDLKSLSIMDIDVDKFNEYQEKQAEYVAAGNAGCYISAFDVKATKDGTAKFDDNDEVGNDSNDSNGRVRTFDYINYNLEYVTAIENASQTVDMAYVGIEFTLEKDPSEAVLNQDTFNWCENMATTYYYEDGTSSTIWNKNKVVTKQVLTGRRKITNNAEINAIPGVGTLSFGVYVKGAKNGDTIQPKFKCWIEGSDVIQECASDEILITAEPRYNVRLARSGYTRQTKLVYFNDDSTSVTRQRETDEDYYGRMQNYALTIELYNTDQDKGLKGIELPKGDITFDVTVTSNVNGTDVTNTAEYNPVLWLWKENNNEVRYAPNGRDASILGNTWYGTPWVGVGTRDNKFYIPSSKTKYWSWAYDGGNYSLVQEGNVYHVTLKDYSFDVDKFTFPTTYYGNSENNANMKSNQGAFSSMYLAVLDHFPEEVSVTSNLQFAVETSNFHATSISGQETNIEMKTTDNLNRIVETLYPTGGFNDWTEVASSSTYYAADGNIPLGGTDYVKNSSRPNLGIDKEGETILIATNGLLLFDADNLELTGDFVWSNWLDGTANDISNHTKTILYAAKPDKTGWTNDEEMNTIAEENLIYFDSVESLESAGYICVGVLVEYRNFRIEQGGFRVNIGYKCKDTASVGNVAMLKCKSRGWNEEKGEISSWKNVVYDESIGAYGIGTSETGWSKDKVYEEFPTPSYFVNQRYVKTQYKDGVITGGHTGGYSAGNSLLIIGDKTEVKIDVDNKKVSYDMDLGERTVTYNVKPFLKVASNNSEITGSDQRDNVYINVKLPKDLHYIPGTASIEPASVVENDDGTTTINWIYYNRVVGDNLEEFTFDASIGKAGTKDDVVNMQQIKAIATISSDMDKRQHVVAYNNYSETTINIIKLATSSISKSVERELVEEDEDFVWTLNYGNTSEIAVEQVRMYDVLPYNGDGRGTSFHGSYKLKEVTFDFSDAPKTFAKVKDNTNVKYTKDMSVRNEDKSETILNSGVGAGWSALGNKTINGNKITFTNVSLEDITALYLDFGGDVEGNEFVYVKLKASPVNTSEKQQPKDVYVNSFYQYATNQIAIVCSNIAKVEVVERNLSGIAWIDINKNGMQDEGEEKISGKEIKLYRTDKSKSDAAGTTTLVGGTNLYKAYDIFGNEVPSVTTDSNGAYRFEHLEQGTYVTVMSGLEEFLVTQKNAGTDKTIDSDAVEISRNAAGKLSLAGVYDIVLPTIDNMTSSEYSSKNNDFGYYYNTRVKILKTDEAGNAIAGAQLKLVDKNGNTIEEWATTTEAKTFDGKLTGGENYTLKEVTAANGYGCVNDITFKVAEDGNVMTVTMKDPKTKVKIQKVNLEGTLIAGAKLQVLDTAKNVIVDNITSDVTAIILEGKLNAEQTYILHEVSAPKGYVVAEDVEFTVARNGKAEVSMTDDYAKGKLKIVKKDNNDELLSGVKFEITDKNNNKVDEIITDTTGVAISKDLITLNSPYKYKEIEVPENIVIDSTSYSFTLENDGQIITKEITNQIKTGSVKITKKISSTDNSEEGLLTGAKFSATLKTDNSKVYYSVEKETGIYEITGLQYGEYVIEEVIVPENTLKCANYDVNVVEHEKVYEKNITDISKKMQITIFKEDIETGITAQGDASLDGAEYTIYRDSACTDAIETLTIAKNADGTHSATSGKYLVGTYYVKETKAPIGYNIDKTVYTVAQNPADQVVELSQHSVVSKEKVFKNDIEIYKYLEATDSTEKQYLAGVEFSATLNSDTSKKYSATTDNNGYCKLENLPYGTYTLKETIYPDNAFDGQFEVDGSGIRVKTISHSILVDKNTTTIYSYEDITNIAKKMQITIYKEDAETGATAQGDSSLDGAEYTIYRDSACTNAVETLTIAPNADGTHSATSGEYLVGTYYVKETKAPTGYNIDETVHTVSQNPLTQTVELSQHSVTSKEPVVKNDIEIHKYLEATDSTEKQPLSGVEFSATLNSDTSKKYSATTDNNGYCKLENLPYGTYTLTETIYPDQAFDGQFEVDESGTRVKTISHSILVDKNTTTIYSYEDITNISKKMQITIFKEDAETGITAQGDASLDGAEYTIYRDSACTDAVETLTIAPNADGTHSATSGKYLVGAYYVKETKAPTGYNIDKTVYIVNQNPLSQTVELSQHRVTSKERVIKNSIEITKYIEETDSTSKNKLSGAIFKATLVSDESKVYYSNPTNNNGYTKFENLPYGTYKIVESTVPDVALEGLFYIGDSNERVSEITQAITEDYTKALTYNYSNITDVSKRMQITIVKEDTETGIIAQGDASLDGAEYTIYRDSACTDVVETLTIAPNADGTHSATSGEYLVGTYYVKETKAPTGYNIDKTIYPVEQVPGEQTVEISYHQTKSSEDVIKGNIEITKELSETDYDSKINLAGAQFSATLLSDNSKVYYSNISQEDGICRIDNLPYGTYEVEETIVPESALKCKNYTVSISENGKTYYNTIVDKSKLMQIEIDKILLAQTVGKTDAKVSGAYFTIYKDEACQVPYIDKNGQVVVVGPTDNNGHVTSGKMRTGIYYFKETTFPEGINPDALVPGEEVTFRDKVYKVEGNNETQAEENKKYSFEVTNITNLGSIYVRKYDNIKGGSENRPSKGAILRLTLVSSKGTVYYDATIEENGYAKFENQELKALGYEYTIPYGEYEITEIKESDAGEHTYYYINPEKVVIQRNKQKEYRIFADEPVEMYLRIVKKDSIAKNIVAIEGARFKVWDIKNKKFVSQMTYPSGEYIDEFETNENGNLILPYKLEAGEYIVYETKSPNGYYLEEKYRVPEDERKIGDKDVAGQYLKIDKQALGVDEDTPATDQDLIYTVYMNDRPLKGKIQIHKIGNAFKEVVETTTEYGKKYEPKFKLSGIEGVKYNIVAAEDIYSTDRKSVYVTKGTIVDTVVTGEDGYVTTNELYLGKYNIVEVETPAGYIPESQSQEVEVSNEDEKVLVNIVEKELVNRKQSVKLEFRKEFENIGYTNCETEEKKAVFGIYAKEDLKNNAEKVLIRKDSLVNIMEMNSEGIVESTIDLPEGKYYVRELETSRPYHISLDEYEFDVVYDKTKEDLEYTINEGKVKNEIEYASLSIIKIPSSIGQETMLVNGMNIDTSILDETIKEILDKIKGMKKSEIVELFREEGISTIPGAEYTIYLDKECTKALLKENGEEEKLIIGEEGIATVEKIPLGKYYIKETKSPAYMEISDEVLEVELTIENKDEMIYKMVSEEYVVGSLLEKKDLFTQEAVPDCVFEITNEEGEVILNSKTDSYGKAGIPTSLFENGKKYYFREISAPEMYEINKEPQEFIARYDETTYKWLAETSEFTNIRKSKQVRIIKQDEKTGEALEGCVFSVVLLNEDGSIKTNESGEMIYLVENGVTDENGEYLVDKAYYGTYKFIEVKAPEGYEINEEAMEGYTFTVDKNSPERIDFIVTNTGDIAVMALLCIALVSVIGIVFVILKNKKQRV